MHIIDRLKHFESHSREVGDMYGAEVLYRARQTIDELEADKDRALEVANEMFITISNGRKASIGSPNNTRVPQIGVDEIDRWRTELDDLAPRD